MEQPLNLQLSTPYFQKLKSCRFKIFEVSGHHTIWTHSSPVTFSLAPMLIIRRKIYENTQEQKNTNSNKAITISPSTLLTCGWKDTASYFSSSSIYIIQGKTRKDATQQSICKGKLPLFFLGPKRRHSYRSCCPLLIEHGSSTLFFIIILVIFIVEYRGILLCLSSSLPFPSIQFGI